MKFLKVKNKRLSEGSFRFDATFHLSEGVNFRKIIENSGFQTMKIGDVVDQVFYGGRDRRIYVETPEKGLPFMGSADMLKNDFNNLKLISKKLTKNIGNYKLKKDWILVSRSGTIGNMAYTNADFEGLCASEHIIRIVPKSNIFSGYLYSYLSSKYGYSLLTQGTFGNVIQHIEPDHIENIPIPILPEETQQKIHNLIADAARLRVEANKLLKEAVEIFEKYDVDGFTKIFQKKVSALGFSWASYNNNVECDKIENSISEFLKIGDVATKCFAPPLFKHIYLDKDNGHPFLTGAELTKFNKKFYRWLSPRGVKNIEDYKVKKGTLLLYKSGTTDGGILGNVFIADDILDDACLSDHVIRIFTEDIKMSYWMFAFYKSRAGVKLLQKTATGSMIPFITPERLRELKFPKPDDNFEFVTNNIEKYLEKSVQSQLNENQAIDLIEKEIDQWQQ